MTSDIVGKFNYLDFFILRVVMFEKSILIFDANICHLQPEGLKEWVSNATF